MQQSSKAMLATAGVIVVALILFFVLRQPQPSDQEQIVAQMQATANAASHHDTSGIMREISADYQGQTPADGNVDELHLMLSRSIGRAGALDIDLTPPQINVQDNTATSHSHLRVRTREAGNLLYNQDITLRWKKEDGTRLLVFPTKVWRIIGAEFPSPDE